MSSLALDERAIQAWEGKAVSNSCSQVQLITVGWKISERVTSMRYLELRRPAQQRSEAQTTDRLLLLTRTHFDDVG